jgi:hypothetical protein
MAPGAIFHLSLGIQDTCLAHQDRRGRVRNVQLDRVGLEFLKFQKTERERLQSIVLDLLFARASEKKALFDEARASLEL